MNTVENELCYFQLFRIQPKIKNDSQILMPCARGYSIKIYPFFPALIYGKQWNLNSLGRILFSSYDDRFEFEVKAKFYYD